MKLVNVSHGDELPRVINADLILEVSPWMPEGAPEPQGTVIKMAVSIGKNDDNVPFLMVLNTPFAEVMRRLREDHVATTNDV